MVEIGNFQINSSIQQKDPRLKTHIFTDTGSLSQNLIGFKILDLFGFTSWSQAAITAKFNTAISNASKVDGLVFLGEEWYKPSRTPQISTRSAQGGYTIEGVAIPSPSNEDQFILALLKAWVAMCRRLGKKAVLCGSPAVCSDDAVWTWMYGSPAVSYIASNFDIIILYHYPTTLSAAQGAACTQQNKNPGKNDARSYISYWKEKGFKGKIIYIIVTKFPDFPGSTDINVIKADFKSAADAGADTIVTYPYANGVYSDGSAATRLIDIYNWYTGGIVTPTPTPVITPTPSPTQTPRPGTLTVSITGFPDDAIIKVNNQNINFIKKG